MECPSSCLQHEGFEYTRLVFWVHTAHVCSTSDLSTHGSSVVSSPSSYVVSTTYITYYNVMFLCFKSYSLDVFLPFPSSYLSSVNHQHAHKLLLFSTSGKAVHWRNQNSWMALVQTFQKTALSPFIYPSLSQGPFWTATAIALLGLLDLGLCAGLKRQKKTSEILSIENPLFFVHSKVTISYINSRSYLHQVLLTLTRFIKAVFEHHKTAISRSFLLFCLFEMNCLLIARVRGTWVYTEVMSQTALLCNFEWPGFIKFWSRSKRNLQEKVGKQHVHRNSSQQEKF